MRSLLSRLWTTCFPQRTQVPVRSRKRPARLGMEALENRDCPAAGIALIGTTVTITGSGFGDQSNVWIGDSGTPGYPFDDYVVANLWYTDTNHAVPIPVAIQQVTDVWSFVNGLHAVVTAASFSGGAGNDEFVNYTGLQGSIYGGTGNDTLTGGSGGDMISGDMGNDILSGGAGNDSLYGGGDNDMLDGWTGNDMVNGGAGNDVLYGWTGDDYLYGEGGQDTLYGEDGNDYLHGGIDGVRDYLYGGAGADRFAADWYWDPWAARYVNRDNPSDFNYAAGDRIV